MAIAPQWRKHIEAWHGSGLTQAAYCERHRLNRNTFAARLSDYRKSHEDSPTVLIPVEVQRQSSAVEGLVLESARGRRLLLPSTISASWLAELLRCLD